MSNTNDDILDDICEGMELSREAQLKEICDIQKETIEHLKNTIKSLEESLEFATNTNSLSLKTIKIQEEIIELYKKKLGIQNDRS